MPCEKEQIGAATLYLVRHAIAERVSASGRDEDRELTPEGIEKLRQSAHGLSWLGITADEIRASPLMRARQTAAMLGAILAPQIPVTPCPELAPGTTPERALAALRPGAAMRPGRCVRREGYFRSSAPTA